jgi:hypothetical protein
LAKVDPDKREKAENEEMAEMIFNIALNTADIKRLGKMK